MALGESWVLLSAGAGAAALSFPALRQRLQLSRAKHPSLAGHSRLARRIAAFVPGYAYDEGTIFRSDGAPAEVEARRRAGFMDLAASFEKKFPKTLKLTAEAKESLSDLQFTSAYRVPFQYSAYVRARLPVGAFMEASSGATLTDLDGNQFYDLTGSYGVNVFGYDFYKECMAEGAARAAALGPVLGAYHPAVAYNVRRLREISGLDEVSFHMSGTEAVMQAVRLARYHTKRSHIVRFCGAYHGWWDAVQPGPGNPVPIDGTYTLKDMDEDSLHVLRTRRDIACVLVNPLQALHPNRAAPGDGSLVDSGRRAHFDRAAYAEWLQKLRAVCSERGIVLIMDEILVGFRLAPGGAQEYFGVRADMVTYGKTVAGGFPIGVVCGRRDLMRRFYDARPADICFARGTFNAHPYVMAGMQVFLERLPKLTHLYEGLDERWNARAAALNEELEKENLPVRVSNLSTVWTVWYTQPSRYNWMLQYYLRDQGLALSWVGTGRLIFSLSYGEADYQEVASRFVAAVRAMERDGWWWNDQALTNKVIKRRIFREMLAQRLQS
jgi:glutamate-1-semialdehyde 2,1-aminomutase